MKIAIVRLSSLGDIILGMASLQFIRRHLPDCHITWVADKRFADILDHQPDIQQVLKVDLKGLKKERSLEGLTREYRNLSSAGPFDAVIDLHGMIKSAVISSILGGIRFGFDRNIRKEILAGLFYSYTIPVVPDQPAVCRYTSLTAISLGLDFQPVDLTPPQPYLFWGAEDVAATDGYFSGERRTILIVPETSAPYKNYPPEQFARLIPLLDGNVVICHGNDREQAAAVAIAGHTPNARVLPRLTIGQLKAAVARADLVIGGDSGPTHMAWACGIPSITLYGATPVCIPQTAHNLAITSGSRINLRKPDAGDTSVRDIPVEEIARMAAQLPGSRHTQEAPR